MHRDGIQVDIQVSHQKETTVKPNSGIPLGTRGLLRGCAAEEGSYGQSEEPQRKRGLGRRWAGRRWKAISSKEIGCAKA